MPPYNDYKLRMMSESDLRIVLQWRNSERVRMNMYSDELISWDDHCAWFSRIQNSQESRHYIFELNRTPIGVINFTSINSLHGKCSWGFYLGETDVPHGSGSVLGILGMSEAFEHLKIRKLCAEVFAFNEKSLRFHRRLGFTQEGILSQHVWKHNYYQDIVLFACFADQWGGIKKDLLLQYGEKLY